MNYYRDIPGNIHALSDEDLDNDGERLLPFGSIKISVQEAQSLLDAKYLNNLAPSENTLPS